MESISFFLSTFTALVDRIINLEKRKFQDKQDLFNEIVKPLFEELEPVASSYMEVIRNAQQTIHKDPEVNFMEVAYIIKKERDAIVMARIKVSEMASQIRKHINDAEIGMFAKDIERFFYGAESEEMTTASRVVAVFFRAGIDNYLTKEEIKSYLDVSLKLMENQWALIVQRYNSIRIYSLSSTKSIRKQKTQ